ncbi:hypothetical protein AGOR_G00120710 [Albula goreensis]|uniref:Uncharacterized protein n=1 Tax=Albula goreensis TaxID=1534307 RepID=A0A8T3DIQ8_9TELE|nr:hypothetical protein AGOR_G00120710 [Albula goreensis]
MNSPLMRRRWGADDRRNVVIHPKPVPLLTRKGSTWSRSLERDCAALQVTAAPGRHRARAAKQCHDCRVKSALDFCLISRASRFIH